MLSALEMCHARSCGAVSSCCQTTPHDGLRTLAPGGRPGLQAITCAMAVDEIWFFHTWSDYRVPAGKMNFNNRAGLDESDNATLS